MTLIQSATHHFKTLTFVLSIFSLVVVVCRLSSVVVEIKFVDL